MKTLSKIINIIITISIIITSIIGVMAFATTPKMDTSRIQQTANEIHEIEVKSIRDTDPTTWKVVWVNEDYSECYMSINGDIHVFTVYEAYDDIIVIEDFNGELQEYYYTTK